MSERFPNDPVLAEIERKANTFPRVFLTWDEWNHLVHRCGYRPPYYSTLDEDLVGYGLKVDPIQIRLADVREALDRAYERMLTIAGREVAKTLTGEETHEW